MRIQCDIQHQRKHLLYRKSLVAKLPGGGRWLRGNMAANSCFDSIPQTNHVQPWEECHLILNPSLKNVPKCWQEILQEFNLWFNTSSRFMVQRAISVRSVFSQLMAVAISATLVLFQPWARIVMRPPLAGQGL